MREEVSSHTVGGVNEHVLARSTDNRNGWRHDQGTRRSIEIADDLNGTTEPDATPPIAGADFFTVEAWTLRGLTRFYVFFVIDLETRRVQIAGITDQPTGEWVTRVARSLVDDFDGFLSKHRYLIHDRDPLFRGAFPALLRSAGVEPVRLPPQSPNLNAHAERFVRSIKDECLSKIIPIGERHLRHALEQFAEHYHFERNHQGLGNQLIDGEAETEPVDLVHRRERLGGVLRSYHRAA